MLTRRFPSGVDARRGFALGDLVNERLALFAKATEKFPGRGHFHPRCQYAGDAPRQKFGREARYGIGESDYITAPRPKLPHHVIVGAIYQSEQTQRDDVNVIHLPDERENIRYEIER